MRTTLVVFLSVMCAAGLCGMAVAGSIDSAGAPSSGSGMYSLSQIYDYLNSGIEVTPVPAFQEPGAAPGSTMKTTKQIYEDMKAKFDECPATAANVESGVKFFCHVSGSWGVQTGTLSALPRPTATPTSTPTITATPTSTPTSTPLPWGQTKCEVTYGGHWEYDGVSANGCWFLGNASVGDCNSVCQAHGLVCSSSNFNIGTDCAVCVHLIGHTPSQCHEGGSGVNLPMWESDTDHCVYRTGGTKDCDSGGWGGSSCCHELCVCHD
ncbi:MAG: hypothetical protein NTZ78_07975 [Candidatus Aureabacteria bacterium]|nr:hypothetical protein [Candidatus Auribacterota bacterium]